MGNLRRAYLISCLCCGSAGKTLYKLGDHRVCVDCRKKLMIGEKLKLKGGGTLQYTLESPRRWVHEPATEVSE